MTCPPPLFFLPELGPILAALFAFCVLYVVIRVLLNMVREIGSKED